MTHITFLKELPKKFDQIGAVFPSSTDLVKKMLEPMQNIDKPIDILEVGPGTGPMTKRIVKEMGPNDTLTICEINLSFIEHLEKQLQKNQDFKKHQSRIHFFHGPVQELKENFPNHQYNLIVSSLPFVNFPPQLINEIFTLYKELLEKDGYITFFRYLYLKNIQKIIASKKSKTEIEQVENILNQWQQHAEEYGKVKTRISFLNLPPAKVLEYSF